MYLDAAQLHHERRLFGVRVAIRAAAICVAFLSFSPRKDSAWAAGEENRLHFMCFIAASTARNTHPWPPVSCNGSRATFAAAGACAPQTVSLYGTASGRIWVPAAVCTCTVCMASGRFAWIRASLLLGVASSVTLCRRSNRW